MDTHYRQKDFFWGAVVGGTVAALTALLFTTKKGKEIQRQIGDLYDEAEDKAKDTMEKAKEKLTDMKDKAEETVEKGTKKASQYLKSQDDK